MSAAHPNGAICPSCGRFVGPLEQCPYCGAFVRKRLPLRYLRLGSILLALLGLAALLYAVSGASTPQVTVASVEATMNYAYVRLAGQVTRGPVYDPESQELRFYLSDSTGEILVSSFRATTRPLIEQKKIPVAGDEVAVEGTLRVREDFVSLNLSAPDKLQVTHPAARTLKIGEIGRDQNLRRVSVSGDVRDIRTPYKGLTLLSIGDATGEVDVAVYDDVLALSGKIPDVQIGDAVQLAGTVSFYKESPQLALTDAQDLSKLLAADAPVTTSKIAELDGSRVGRRVSIAGTVTASKKFSQGLRVDLDDGSGALTLLLWQDTLAEIANVDQLKKGARVQAIGQLSQYHGALEVTPGRATDVQIVAVATPQTTTPRSPQTADATAGATLVPPQTLIPTRTPTAAPKECTIGSLNASDETQIVIVSGRISKASSFAKGMRYTLDDGTGTITLVVWSDVAKNIKNAETLKVGARVQVTGKLSLYDNALELAPSKGSELILLAQSTIPTPAPRTIASLGTGDVGTVVIVRGTVTKIQDFSTGKYVTLKDGRGEIRVVVYTNVLNAMPDKGKLVEGAPLTVIGEVNLYRGLLEVVPDRGGLTIE